MKLLPRLTVFAWLFMLCGQGFATHMVGNDLTWSCNPQDPCEYTFTLSFYRDCAGVNHIPANLFFTGNLGCTSQPSEVTSGWQLQSTVEITPLCGTVTSTCTGGTFPGVQQIIHTRTYNFCRATPCNTYQVTWGQGDRNGLITSGAANDRYGTSSTITIDPNDCYNSPVFNTVPVAFICAGQTNTFTMNATDPDGDVLQYSLVACEQRNNSGVLTGTVGYNAGFSPTAPLGPSWGTTINATTGDITFTPTPGNMEIGVLCVRVDEFRSGVLVGSVVRDIQVRVINCRNTPPFALGPDTTEFCVGKEECFQITTGDLDFGQTLTANVITAPAGATVNISGQPPVIDICWTPTAADIGTHFVTIEVRDDACPINGVTQRTFVLEVKECDPCSELNLDASFTYTTGLNSVTVTNTSTGSGITFTEFIWGDMTPNTIRPGNWTTPETHTYADPGTYEVCVVIQAFIGNLCCHDTICETIVITDDPCDFHDAAFYAQASIQNCTYCFFDVSTPGSSYQYWDFGDGSPLGTGSSVCHTYPGSGTYTITLTSVYHPPSNPSLCCYSTESVTWYIPCLKDPKEEKELQASGGIGKAEINYNNQESRLSITLTPAMVQNEAARVQIYSASGQLIRELPPMQNIHSEEYLSGLSQGVYLVRVSGSDFAETYRFMKL